MRGVFWMFSMLAILSACGGAEPRAEATWETHTTAPEDEADEPSEEAPEEP